jgi:hypothetical protein
MWITGFKGARGQVEFMLPVVENAPALEVITVDTHKRSTSAGDHWTMKSGPPPFEEAKRIAMTCLSRAMPPSIKLLDVIFSLMCEASEKIAVLNLEHSSTMFSDP